MQSAPRQKGLYVPNSPHVQASMHNTVADYSILSHWDSLREGIVLEVWTGSITNDSLDQETWIRAQISNLHGSKETHIKRCTSNGNRLHNNNVYISNAINCSIRDKSQPSLVCMIYTRLKPNNIQQDCRSNCVQVPISTFFKDCRINGV